MPSTLVQLLHQAFSVCISQKVTILFGAILFGVFSAGVSGIMVVGLQDDAESFVQEMGMDPSKLEELKTRIEAGDPAAQEEVRAQIEEITAGIDQNDISQAAIMSSIQVVKGMATSMFVLWLISLLAGIYFTVVALERSNNVGAIIKRSFEVLFPMIGLSIWIFIRTFAWIPFIGFIIAIVLGPRFVCAPVLLIKDHRGIFESASISYQRTRGYWWKIFSNVIVAVVCGALVIGLINIFIGQLSRVSMLLGVLGTTIVSQLLTAFVVIFAVQLAVAILFVAPPDQKSSFAPPGAGE